MFSLLKITSGDWHGLVNRVISSYGLYLLVLLFLVLVVMTVVVVVQRRMLKTGQSRSEVVNGILAGLQPGRGLEKGLSALLGVIIPLVEADGFYFYLRDQSGKNYVLKAVRFRDTGDGVIAPSYSGLVPYSKDKYNPRLGFSARELPEEPHFTKDGEVPLLVLPVKGGVGLIQAGPVRRVPRMRMALLRQMGEQMQPVLETITAIDRMHGQVETISASSEAMRSLTRSAFDLDGSLSTMMGLGGRIIDAAGACLLLHNEQRPEVAVIWGLDQQKEDLFRQDHTAQSRLQGLLEGREFLVVNRERQEYALLPAYLATAGVETLMLFKVRGKTYYGTAIFWYHQTPVVEQYRVATLQALVRRLGDILDRQSQFKELSDAYLGTLRTLVTTVDNLDPYTVGHSELVSRYAGIIAREMRLSPQDIQEILQAGYLHDLGMLGLSGQILFKSGRFTEIELETMKLHSEVGAAIMEATIANKTLATYIRHHHERWDGYGYPAGLKGEQIPLGARIIAVADMFNAKMTPRKYREPLPFGRALADLKAAAGTQLDSAGVNALSAWFSKKQADPQRHGRSLGPCWEMKCCPPNISKLCSAFNRNNVNCWEVKDTLCAAHGNTCSSCVVYTEFAQRNRPVREG